MNSRKKPAFRRSLTLGVLTRFIMTCVLFTLGSFVALYLGMFVCYLLPWNGGILYGILITIRDNVVFFMGLFLVCGYVVIFLIYWGKTLGYLGDVVRATEQIYKGGDGPVILPAALHDIENQMNQIKSDMLASRRAAEDAEKRKNDLVVYLAVDLETSLERMKHRQEKTGKDGDIHEKDVAYLAACLATGSRAAEHYGWKRVDFKKDGQIRELDEKHEEIFSDVLAAL